MSKDTKGGGDAIVPVTPMMMAMADLRDRFAMAALTGACGARFGDVLSSPVYANDQSKAMLAAMCYEMADAMMKARG